MIKTIKKISTFVFVLLVTISAQAQRSSWKPVNESKISSSELLERNNMPTKFKLFSLNNTLLNRELIGAPSRFSTNSSSVKIAIPTKNGELQNFIIREGSLMSDGLKARFPGIRTYIGTGIEDPNAVASISVGSDGVHVMITSNTHETLYIDPYTKDTNNYILYSRKDVAGYDESWECGTEATLPEGLEIDEDSVQSKNADDGMLFTYRLALAANFEYSTFHINRTNPTPVTDEEKKAAVLSAQVTAMNRVNGIFERDTGITMEIIPNNDEIIFITSDDGLNNTSSVIDQIQARIDGIIGFTNYDIGHVFTTGGGGVASLQSPCSSGKARGVTGLPQPVGDRFFIDFVAHEMGHQYGAPHVQNNINNQCQLSSGSSIEPGSGSTIMGYAGICAPNVQNSSDDYFNGISIIQMVNFSRGNGDCAAQITTNNEPPVVEAGPNYIIPISTPFRLDAVASDPDGNESLTYCWEQRDAQFAAMPPRSNSDNVGGPMFRSLEPVAESDRYFPTLNTILLGQDGNTWEQTPSVTRALRFRVTVRDNVVNGGASQSDINVVNVNDAGGPFMITSQNSTGTVWTTQTAETITWDVAGTDGAPFNTATVDILFSEDGGLNFDRVILSGTPNDGSQDVNVPTVNTTQGRFMVVASDNIYFDINDRDITVVGSLGVDDVALSDLAIYPNPTDGLFTISFSANAGEDVNIAMYDVRGRLINTKNFSNSSADFDQRLDYRNLSTGIYFVTVTNGSQKTTKKLTIR